jgi:integrase
MTGWRIGQLLGIRREDVDLDAGTIVTRFRDNKGKRDQLISLHPIVVDHLKKMTGFHPRLFPWPHGQRRVFEELHRLQRAANVKPAEKDYYGFHDLRRAFATMNAERMTVDALQHLMQHKDYTTTQRYINMARQLTPAVQNLFVPDLTRKAGGENG